VSKQEPTFHRLEFANDVTFWTEGETSKRRTFLMPLLSPSEFLAFGVLSPSDRVLFVARGRVVEDLGDFVARMLRAGASVELYAQPPLPASVWKDYVSDDPYESKNAEPPPPPPPERASSPAWSAPTMKEKDSPPGKESLPASPLPMRDDGAASHRRRS
jgi:hypothetical protein